MIVGIIPAAGKGSRLNFPAMHKEMLPVTEMNNKLITPIETNIVQLAMAGIGKAVIVLRKEKNDIRSFLGPKRFGVELYYVYQNISKNFSREGLPDAFVIGATFAKNQFNCSRYVMLMGDVVFGSEHVVPILLRKEGSNLSIGIWYTTNINRFGAVDFTPTGNDSRNGVVNSIVDKPKEWNEYNDGYHWGVAYLDEKVLNYVKQETETFSNAMHRAIENGCSASYVIMPKGYYDFGNARAAIDNIVKLNQEASWLS